MRITEIRLTNIRLFKSLVLPVALKSKQKPRMRTLFIGQNGTCKSTLLRCLAIGLTASQSDRVALLEQLGSSLVGPDGDVGVIELTLASDGQGGDVATRTIRTEVRKGETSQSGFETTEPAPVAVFGYGPGRQSSGSVKPGSSSATACRTLFRFDERLVDPELALRRLRDFLGTAKYAATMTGIKRAVGLNKSDEIIVERGGGVVLKTKRGTFPLTVLADGHRVPFGFALDLYHSALQAGAVTKTGGIRGVLLLDEIEQHLHPSLQVGVLRRFSRLWPELQLFATTHSPLVTLGAKSNEVVSLKRHGASVKAIWPAPNFAHYSADDMLESPQLFDTVATSSEQATTVGDYQKLAAMPAEKRTAAQTAKLRNLAAKQSQGQVSAKPAAEWDDLLAKFREKFQL